MDNERAGFLFGFLRAVLDAAEKFEKSMREAQEAKVGPDSLRPHGRWVRKSEGYGYWYECSECDGQIPLNYYKRWDFSAYCPHCGAKMDLPDHVLAPTDQSAAQYADNPTPAEA